MAYTGIYERTIFYNPVNKYSVISVKTSDRSIPEKARSAYRHRDNMIHFAAVGYELPRTDQVSMILDGEWKEGKNGFQLHVTKCEEVVPQTREGIKGYLSSRLIKGIGGKTAELIVDRFGADTLHVLENEPERLLEIRGVSKAKLEEIIASYYLASAYKDDLTPWKCGYRPHFLSWRDSFEGDTAGHLYFRNLAELLRNTPWQYSQLERFARIAATMDAIPYLNAYVQWPVIEYLVKAKLFRLVSDIVYGPYHFMIGKTVNCEGKNLQDVLKLDRSWLPLLQEVDPGIAQLNVIQWFINAGKKPDASMMKWCANNAIQDVSVLAELLSHMTMHKLMRYADAQYEIRIASTKTPEYIRYYSMANLLADYRDYLRMCKEMQYNVESSFILFPRNLKSAHDHVVEARDVKRTAEQEKAIADSFEEWQRLYQYKGKDLMVIPPHSSKELIDEGTALRHCVGRYVKRVAQRECVILFVRKVAEPDKSLCTVEVRDGQVVQTRGFDNEDPPAKIKAFIERWKRQVLCAADKTAA